MSLCFFNCSQLSLQRSSSFKDFMKPKASSPVVVSEATLDETVGSFLTFCEISLYTFLSIFKPCTSRIHLGLTIASSVNCIILKKPRQDIIFHEPTMQRACDVCISRITLTGENTEKYHLAVKWFMKFHESISIL